MSIRTSNQISASTALLLTLSAVALAAQFEESFPDTPAEAMALYESDADSWIKGPVQYAMLEAERDAFKALVSTAQRTRFIAEFWERRDHDLRDRTNPYKLEFYTRVAAANDRYNEYPKGWKSDRGQIHIVLGKPDFVRFIPGGAGRATAWTYRTIGPQGKDSPVSAFVGEFQIVFRAVQCAAALRDPRQTLAPGIFRSTCSRPWSGLGWRRWTRRSWGA